uniref:H/ACA ribonucleoprotein complex subunit 2 n=1 Tax=Fibrocapsa japonica TaxID=94617 RepID=A0A7S2UX33_9STRA|mmetsp:Transcript_17882/g.26054  ORF Transcript_17882/g.26054 Transcript_17882/m.26054 type:complete len:160 (+) Transcript_17882:75-554(+)|eukprot:CAMPEP_0113941890 /NCGR_PEP_ID=MMETSP1339-20121228/7722_1 /TAXON_ID=94617 /ORGANISM="Fibrocapsa japonica" /LENGTH=159 /DNA_ID=CAMNT_0000946173 /DNA_START=51 /DNA_END=530 /DNA_ORIENTATION=+ /assembly_acc=CAM_ASM_000762
MSSDDEPKQKKEKKEGKKEKKQVEQKSYEERMKAVSVIAKPMAPPKLTKKMHKLVKKASKAKCLRRGVKEVVKSLKKKEKGLCIIAGDISPIDVISHIPILCEEASIPYIYVPSKQDLGGAALTKRPTSTIFVVPKGKFKDQELYDSMVTETNARAIEY